MSTLIKFKPDSGLTEVLVSNEPVHVEGRIANSKSGFIELNVLDNGTIPRRDEGPQFFPVNQISTFIKKF